MIKVVKILCGVTGLKEDLVTKPYTELGDSSSKLDQDKFRTK